MNALPAALISILVASVGVGFAQEADATAQLPGQAVFLMMRDAAGGVTSKRRIRVKSAVEAANRKGCLEPVGIEWQPLVWGFTAEQEVPYWLRSRDLVRIVDVDTSQSRYGLRLPSNRLV